VPGPIAGGKQAFVLLTSIITAHLQDLSPVARYAASRSSASRATPN